MKYFLLVTYLVFSLFSFSQKDSTKSKSGLWKKVDVMPEFSGGQAELFKYLGNNLKYPPYCRNNGIQGKVYISFIVLKDGNLDSIKVTRGVHPLLDEQAIEIIKAMPKWKPGQSNGEAVDVKYNMPINFVVHNNSSSGSKNRAKGMKNFEEEDYETAIYYFSKIIKVNKKDAGLYYYRGVSYHRNGKTKKAIKDLEKSKELGSKKAEEYLKTIK